MTEEVIRSNEYFNSEEFDCSPAFLLKELASRAEYWSRNVDGTYSVPTGQSGQIYEMAIAANLKGFDGVYWRDLTPGEAVKAGDRFYSPSEGKWIVIESEDVPPEVVKSRDFPTQRLICNE